MPEHTTFEDEGTLLVTVRYPFTRNGTTVTFEGEDGDGRTVVFAADWRVAQDIIEALYDDGSPVAVVPPWSVLTITDPEPVTTITVAPEGTTVTTPTGGTVTAAPTDLGLSDECAILHDAAHALLAAHLGLAGSPVLERVADGSPLSQEHVDLEEAATFALQAWCAALRGEDPAPALANVRAALDRLTLPIQHGGAA